MSTDANKNDILAVLSLSLNSEEDTFDFIDNFLGQKIIAGTGMVIVASKYSNTKLLVTLGASYVRGIILLCSPLGSTL